MRLVPPRVTVRATLCALLLTPALASAQTPRGANPDELLLRSGVVVPPLSARLAAPAERATARHLIVQLENGHTEEGIAALTASGVRVLEWIPRNAVSAFVPAGVDPLAIPGVRWAGKLTPADKLAVAPKSVDEEVHVLVDFFPGVKRLAARAALKRVGAREIVHPYLRGNTLLVEIDAARLNALASQDEVSFVYPASKAVETKQPLRSCGGAITAQGAVPNYVASGDGWDGFGQGSAALEYFFANGTPDIASEQGEVLRALNTWSQSAAITWSAAPSSGRSRSLDILWASGSHGDGNAFDGPFGVLAHAYFPSPPNPETIAGDVHFDEDETWTQGPGMDQFSIALHEIGHALGLGHSADPTAVMYPQYAGGVFAGLASDDVAGIRALYAPGGGSGADAFEPDDTLGAARAITPGSQQSHSIFPAADVDHVRFSLAGPADVVIDTSGTVGDTRLWLYDANLNPLDFNDDATPTSRLSRIERTRARGNSLPAGTYFARVDEFGNNDVIANYNLGLQVVSHAIGDSFEPDDTAAQAVPMLPNATFTRSIAPASDGDYSRFTLVETSEVSIEASGGNGTDDTRMWLFAQDLSAIEFNDDGGTGLHARIDRTRGEGNPLPPGTYYVLVDEDGNDDEIASYSLHLGIFPIGSSGADDNYEENDSTDFPWSWGASWEGIWLSAIAGSGIQLDDDIYRIDVSPGDERVLATLRLKHADGDIDLYLIDYFGNVLASSTSLTDEESIDTVVPPGGGVYYLAAVYENRGNPYDLWWDDVLAPIVVPSNDAFADRIALAGAHASTSGNNTAASKEPGEPSHAGVPGGVSVWWTWTAPQTADVEIDTSGSSFDTLLGVYTGSSVAGLTHVASDDDTATSLQAAVSFRATASTAYAIAVDGYNGTNGAISLSIAQSAPAAPTYGVAWSSLSAKCRKSGVCKLKGKLLVRNLGPGRSPLAQVSIYLSDDNTQDAGDSVIGGGAVSGLRPGKAKKMKLARTLAPGVRPTGKFVIAVLASGGATQTVVYGPLP